MSNSTPPDRRPPRLRDDEPIALLVTFLVFGALFAWVVGQGRSGFDLASFWPMLTGSSPQTTAPSPGPTVAPSVVPAPSPAASVPAVPGTQQGGLGASPVPSPASDSVDLSESGTVTVEGATPSPSPQPGVVPVPAPVPGSPGTSGSGTTQNLNPTAPGKPIAFADVPETYWAYPFISTLSAQGIIGGFPDGTFKPDQPVTRAQFAVQIQKAFTKPSQLPPKAFSDVPPGSKWSIAVDQAVKAGFMSGYPEGYFGPEQQVTRTEAVISVVRGLGLQPPADPEAILQPYTDKQQIPSWARARIATAIQQGIFSGDPDTKQLAPNQPASRADIAALVYKALEVDKPR